MKVLLIKILLQDHYHFSEVLWLVFRRSTLFFAKHVLSTLIKTFIFTFFLAYLFPVAFFLVKHPFYFFILRNVPQLALIN